ncbi:hypothetical protein BDN72DRAFT_836759 [Pluteus cervinus]|uniref:Uncharacterized protein n=1 Tax=Pluteus cervinus TaxID=181527 RepID=A0ACD3B4V2_9AGAR|nr:hypothetical protein BDN72DRAFT_836759 [Pluteus cervinus]
MAAYNHPGTAPILARVAKYIFPWVAPMIFNVVTLGMRNKRREPSLEALGRHGQYVRHMFIGDADPMEIVAEQLSSCPNVENLALWTPRTLNENCLQVIKLLPLLRLYTYTTTIFNHNRHLGQQAKSLFPQWKDLTHLTIYGSWSPAELHSCWRLLPKLQCLAFPVGHNLPSVFFNECPELRMLLLLNDGFRDYEDDLYSPNDPRMVRLRLSNSVTDWKLGARGGMDAWAHAEDRLEERADKIEAWLLNQMSDSAELDRILERLRSGIPSPSRRRRRRLSSQPSQPS